MPPTPLQANIRPSEARRPRIRLSLGGRPRGLADEVELIVAHRLGHTLSPLQGCLVQLATLVVAGFLLWAVFASGLAGTIADALGRFATQNMHFGPRPTP